MGGACGLALLVVRGRDRGMWGGRSLTPWPEENHGSAGVWLCCVRVTCKRNNGEQREPHEHLEEGSGHLAVFLRLLIHDMVMGNAIKA